MSRKRKYFTLLEVMIALSLTLIILSGLLAAYLNVEKSTALWQKEEKLLYSERFFSHRLSTIFKYLEAPDQNKTFFFTTDSSQGLLLSGTSSLIFSYDNGISLDSQLSGSVLGRLFVDSEGNLTLITWPERELWKDLILPSFHREVLLNHIKDLRFSFFLVSSNQESNHSETGWVHGTFSKERKELPGAIKMIITSKDDKEQIFYFPIPQILSIIKENA